VDSDDEGSEMSLCMGILSSRRLVVLGSGLDVVLRLAGDSLLADVGGGVTALGRFFIGIVGLRSSAQDSTSVR
jgi:hypothetical protein